MVAQVRNLVLVLVLSSGLVAPAVMLLSS
jgi:hypothetical protein